MIFGIISLVVSVVALILVFVFKSQLRKEIEANKLINPFQPLPVAYDKGHSWYFHSDEK